MDNRLQVTLEQLAGELSLEVCQVASVVQLLDDENTVPFITRYRKEQTGNLDEVQIREIERRVQFQRQLAEKAANILRLVETQGKLTDELKQQIESATTLKRLDDLYLPFFFNPRSLLDIQMQYRSPKELPKRRPKDL